MAERDWIYLDNNATTRPAPEVVAAMMPYLGERFGNPSSLHALGSCVRRDLDRARERVAAFFGCEPGEVVFTSGGTEAANLAVRGALAAARRAGRRRVVTTAVEHPCVGATLAHLAAAGECETAIVPVGRDGGLDLGALRAALARPAEVALVSVMWANHETGVLFPIEEVGALCRAAAVPLHVDAVQAAGKMPLGPAVGAADLLSISAHKLHGPKGAGALYVRRGTALEPQMAGGRQERGRRAGTENVAGVLGLATGCDLAARALAGGAAERMAALRDRLEARIFEAVPGVARNGAAAPRVANTASLRFEGVDGEGLLIELSRRGIAASSGSACTSGSLEPSHVLTAMGLGPRDALGSIRLSLSRETTEAEVDHAATVIADIVRLFRSVAPGAAPGPRARAAAPD
jgi:cysteine desulfurase